MNINYMRHRVGNSVVEYEQYLQATIKQLESGDASAASKPTFTAIAMGSSWEGRSEVANDLLELPTKTLRGEMDKILG